MSNFLNFAVGALTGAMSASPLQSQIDSAMQQPAQSQRDAPVAQSRAGELAGLLSRDAQLPEIANMSSVVNLLQQAANSLGSGTGSVTSGQQLTLPPLPPMPAPAKPAAVATDDHGQSNIVFSDAGTDGTLIH